MVNTEFNRKRRMEECREVSYFYNFDIFEVLPDDFKITIDYENNPLREVFQKLWFYYLSVLLQHHPQ